MRNSASCRPKSRGRGVAATTSIRSEAEVDVVTRAHSVREHVAAWRRQGDTVGFVQTMGCIHKGHLALIAHARTRTTRVVVSVFVNPLQFDANEDFGRYPRTIEHDKLLLADVKTDLLFTPTPFEMYPTGF